MNNSTVKKMLKSLTKQKAVIAGIILLVAMAFLKQSFYSYRNLFQILNTVSVNAILASGVTVVLICGGCDMSIGGMMGLSGITAIMLMKHVPISVAIIAAVILGAIVGFINGFLVVHQKTEAFIITLGTGMILKGCSLLLTSAHPISPSNLKFMMIANGTMADVFPNLVVIMVVVLIAMQLLLRLTQFGRNCYAVGGDYEVAVYSGINALRVKWMAYIICGAMAAIGGVLNSSLLNTGSAIYGDTTPLLVHCASVIGGTSLMGGIGDIPKSFTGLLVIAILQNAMNILGISSYVQMLLQGVMIVLILWLDCFGRKIKRETV